jgi:hypothetical protein
MEASQKKNTVYLGCGELIDSNEYNLIFYLIKTIFFATLYIKNLVEVLHI